MNEKEFEYLGITKFHKKGYAGKNITIASKEDILKDVFDDVECSDPFIMKSNNAEHGTSVMDFIRQVVPDARKIATGLAGSIKSGVWKCKDMDKLLQDPPDILTSSNYDRNDHEEIKMEIYKKLRDKGCFLISGAGNNGTKGVLKMVENDVFKAVGACRFKDGELIKTTASSEGKALDFMSLDNLVATWNDKKEKGTSFAAPVFAGMCGLVQDFFIEKTGEKLTHDKLIEFIMDHCVDLEETGRDNKTGYGIFILPDPDDIDIYKYSDTKMFKDETYYLEAIDFLAEKGEMDSPDLWKIRITEENDVDLMWFCIKWANAVARLNYR